MFSKVSCLYTGKTELSSRFLKIVYPQLREAMPFYVRRRISLTPHLANSDIPENDGTVYSLDFRHWYYDEDTFESYVLSVADQKPKYLFVFDNPFENERPWQIDIKTFVRRLNMRARKLVEIVKASSPDTFFIAPWISIVNYEFRNYYTSFMKNNRHLFDAYSVLCANDMTDISVGGISGTLADFYRTDPKPVFVLCAVPSGDKISQIERTAEILHFEPLSEKDAGTKILRLYELFHNISKGNMYFMYFGLDKDVYDPFREPTADDFWDNYFPIDLYVHEQKWNWFHYLGMLNYQDKVKSYIVKSLIELAKKENNNNSYE